MARNGEAPHARVLLTVFARVILLGHRIKPILAQCSVSMLCFQGYFPDIFNAFCLTFTFLYPLETSENQRFSEVFSWCRNGTLGYNALISIIKQFNSFYANHLIYFNIF